MIFGITQLGFTSHKAGQPLQVIELKKEGKDKNCTINLISKTLKMRGSKAISVISQREAFYKQLYFESSARK